MHNKPHGTKTDTSHCLGFMQGEIPIPDDFNLMGKDQIADLFEAVSIATCGHHLNRKDANKR